MSAIIFALPVSSYGVALDCIDSGGMATGCRSTRLLSRYISNSSPSASRQACRLTASLRHFPIWSTANAGPSTPLRPFSSSSSRLEEAKVPVQGAEDISHAHFLASASPTSDFNPTQSPSAGVDRAHPWEGRLSPTTSHLFKLVLPLPTKEWLDQSPQPTAFLLHPSQPLSHLSRLIAGSLPPEHRDVDITYLALTGSKSDLDSHLRNAEAETEEAQADKPASIVEEEAQMEDVSPQTRQEGGPRLNERSSEEGRWQEVSWSQSTDLSDFIKQSCLDEKFKIVIQPQGRSGTKALDPMTLSVHIPSFESRTRYLRKRLLTLSKELNEMTKKKKL